MKNKIVNIGTTYVTNEELSTLDLSNNKNVYSSITSNGESSEIKSYLVIDKASDLNKL